MNTIPPSIQNLTQRLIALEVARIPAEGLDGAAVRTCDKLRLPLVKLAGVLGFRTLLSRALALATAEVPWLVTVRVRADGSLEGFDAARGQRRADQTGEAGTVVVAQLLGLLVTFIGEPLTLALVREAWPDAPLDKSGRTAEGQP